MGTFDSFSFWNLVASDDKFYSVGHWPSPTTKYHYQFRVRTLPLFTVHSHGLALRLRNLLNNKGIFAPWVHRIVCLDEEESNLLAAALARTLNLQARKPVIAIPRDKFRFIAGKQVDQQFVRWFETKYRRSSLLDKNVIIVDQAAHHFKTLSALKSICQRFGATVLSFAVFLDRTAQGFELVEYLPSTHYVRLYSWPSGPKMAYECECIEGSRGK